MFQFIHLEGYARAASRHPSAGGKGKKLTAREVVDEVIRKDGNCDHVRTPRPPVLLYGTSPDDALALAEERADTVRDSMGRRLRQDAPIMLAGVVSVPNTISDADASAVFRDAIEFARHLFGDSLASVVQHVDEPHPHIHFYVVPPPGVRAMDLHPGHAAVARMDKKRTTTGERNSVYVEAMRNFQQLFFDAVAKFHGMARIGPGRRRLTRKEWHSECVSNAALRDAMALAKSITEERQRKALQSIAPVLQSDPLSQFLANRKGTKNVSPCPRRDFR